MVGLEFLGTKTTRMETELLLMMDSSLVLTAYNNRHCEERLFPHSAVAI